MKKVIIVGAGISGLSAGVYAAKSGFDVTILEQHTTFGGLSTAWKRKGYYFEGGMHWLTGSSPKLALNKVWKETGALKENNPIENRDPYYTLMNGKKPIYMYRDINKLKNHFLEISPEDSKMIKRFYKDVRHFMNVHLVINDIPHLKTKNPAKVSLSELIKMIPAVFRLRTLSKLSYIDYVDKFKNEDLRHFLRSQIGDRYNALSFVYNVASFASGDCGYPHGGSVLMAQNMLDTFIQNGGKIQYRKKVEKIIIEKNKIKGVQTKDEFIESDSVIVTQDARNAIDSLFEKPLQLNWTKKLRKRYVGEQTTFVSLGIKADLSNLPFSMTFILDKPFEAANKFYDEIKINNYAAYKDHAPEGGTSITCLLLGDSYEYWKKTKEDGTYKLKKDELGKNFVEVLAKFIPEVKENLEVIDIATPLTYERYCSSAEGSWMSVWDVKSGQYNYPQKVKNIDGLYFAGQRILMPGGLPIAVYTGRLAAQYLCRDNKTEFKS